MKAIFMGTPDFAVNSLDTLVSKGLDVALVITKEDKKQGRKMKLEMPAVKKRALELGLEVYQPESVKTIEVIQKIQDINPDVIIVTAYGKILPKEILDIPKYGCINVHASLLPKYRGASPINSCILNGDTVTGITTMYISEGLDAGDIILKDEIDIFIEILENYIKLLFYNGNADIAKIYENNQRYKDTITFLEVMNYRPFCYVPLFMNSITLIQKNLDKTIKLYLSYKIPEYLRQNNIPYYYIRVRKFKGLQDEKSQTNINDIFITKHNIIKHNITLGKCIREIIQNELN